MQYMPNHECCWKTRRILTDAREYAKQLPNAIHHPFDNLFEYMGIFIDVQITEEQLHLLKKNQSLFKILVENDLLTEFTLPASFSL
jgi:lysophospholipase L1-like esterase